MRLSRILLAALIPVFFAACSPNNVTEENSYKKYFDEFQATGTFGLFDNGQGSFTIYNLSRFSDSVFSPFSTYKIVNSLIGLETGAALDSSTVFPYDSSLSIPGRPECDSNLNMFQAFRASCPPWYRQLARKIGKEKMQYYLDTLGYGSRNAKFEIQHNLDNFWLDNTLKVTADENLGLVKKLYFDQLPFQKRTHRILRNMMLWEDNANYKLSYKTGWGTTDKGTQLGWIVGWIEENKHPYFFSLQVESADPNFPMVKARITILKNILKQYGLTEGKM